jgi:hypothetical protein
MSVSMIIFWGAAVACEAWPALVAEKPEKTTVQNTAQLITQRNENLRAIRKIGTSVRKKYLEFISKVVEGPTMQLRPRKNPMPPGGPAEHTFHLC